MEDVGFTEKVFSAAKMTAVVDKLAQDGASSTDALLDVDLSLTDLNTPATRISRNQLIQCYRNAIALSRNPHLAYAIGSSVHLSAYGMYGYAMLCSPNFRSTMDFAVRYHQLATPLANIAFEESDGLGIWTIEPLMHPKIDSQLYRFVVELQIATHISLHRDIMGETFQPREILLAYPLATDFQIPNAIVDCPITFGHQTNRIIFDSSYLDATPKLGNRTTYPSAVSLCDALLEDLTLRIGMVGKIRAILLPDLAQRPNLAAVAKQMRMTPRTLRRQLQSQNTSFRQLANELRIHVALRYLRETRMTTQDIAFALGFSDAANFRHAFRRWTGTTPNEFRQETASA